MLKRMLSAVMLVAVTVVFCGAIAGCEDDVKKTTKIEQTKESEPQMVSPGEPIVE